MELTQVFAHPYHRITDTSYLCLRSWRLKGSNWHSDVDVEDRPSLFRWKKSSLLGILYLWNLGENGSKRNKGFRRRWFFNCLKTTDRVPRGWDWREPFKVISRFIWLDINTELSRTSFSSHTRTTWDGTDKVGIRTVVPARWVSSLRTVWNFRLIFTIDYGTL